MRVPRLGGVIPIRHGESCFPYPPLHDFLERAPKDVAACFAKRVTHQELWKLINYMQLCIFALVPCPVRVGRTLQKEGIRLVGFTVEQVDGAVAKIVADEKQRQKFNPALARETVHQFWHRAALSTDALSKMVAKVVVELAALAPATTSVEPLLSKHLTR